jgi:hypothetical protein
MANHIDDATIEYVGILAKLELSVREGTGKKRYGKYAGLCG